MSDQIPFPKYMQDDSGLVVLFTYGGNDESQLGSGTVVSPVSQSHLELGELRFNWDMSRFSDYNGTLILGNGA